MKCEGCGEKDAEVECGDCAPKGADVDPLLLCNDCCGRVHIGIGRLSKHRVIPLTFRKQQQELKRKYEECQALAGDLNRRKQQMPFCRDDIEERIRIYERQIRESTMLICKKIKQRAITLIKKMKEALGKRSQDMDDFDRYVSDKIFTQLEEINREIQGLEMQSADEYQSKVQEIDAKIDAVDFSGLRNQMPNPCLPYSINFVGIHDDIKALDFVFHEEVNEITELPKYTSETLEEGTEIKVCVQSVVTKSGEFWLQPDFGSETYDKLLDISHKIRKEYMCNLEWKVFLPQDESLQPGVLCCVLYTSDNKWYRARIEELRPDKKSATIRYLDFGNSSIMALPNILPYKCMVQDVPFQAIECRLAGVPMELTHEAKWLFNDTVKDKLLNCKFLNKVTGAGDNHDIWLVELSIVQEDSSHININEIIKERACVKASKEGIKCRDVRLTDENLASTFTIISTTVKTRDSPERSSAESPDTEISESTNDEGAALKISKESERDKLVDTAPNSQDVRNVVRESQDIRNLLRESQDVRNISPRSQDVRNVGQTSQDVRKSSARQSQDGRRSGEKKKEKKGEGMDECTSFLSSIVLGGNSDEDPGGSCGLPVSVTLDSVAPSWQDQPESSPKVQTSSAGKHPTRVESPIESDQLEITADENTLPKTLVTEISIQPAATIVVGVSGSDFNESGPTFFPIGGEFGGLPLKGKPPKHLEQMGRTVEQDVPFQHSVESEAEQVVAIIIQGVVSRFCGTVKKTLEDIDVDEEESCAEELSYGGESRGSDELMAEPCTTENNLLAELYATENKNTRPPLDGDKEQTMVKSIVLEQNPQAMAYAKFARSLSSSEQDNNVKNALSVKPEIQDKSLSNLCDDDDVDRTAVKTYALSFAEQSADHSQFNLCDVEIDQRHTQSLANNIDGDNRSMDVLDDIPPQLGPCEHHVQENVEETQRADATDDIKHVPSAGENGKQQQQSLYSSLPRISFVSGSTFMMYVVDELDGDGSLCVQVARNDVEEMLFSRFTDDLRTSGEKTSGLSNLSAGELILAPFENSWYRAEIENLSANQNEVRVCFVDYGNTEAVQLSSIRALPDKLKYVPHQTKKCSLSTYNRPVFSAEECQAFNTLVLDKRLSATVSAPGYDRLHVRLAMPTHSGEKRDVLDMVEEIVKNQSIDPSFQTSQDDLPYSDQQSKHRFVVPNSKDLPKVAILQCNPPPGFRNTSTAGRGILQGDYPQNVAALPSGPMIFPFYFGQGQFMEQLQDKFVGQSQIMGQRQGHIRIQGQGQMKSRGHLGIPGPLRNYSPSQLPMNQGSGGGRADVDMRQFPEMAAPGPMYAYPPPQLRQVRPRSVSPRPLTEQVEPLRSPSQLREDAAPFHPGSVYISPLKSQESLDERINARNRTMNREQRDGVGGNDQDNNNVESEIRAHTEAPPDEPGMNACPMSLISEPSVSMSSFFDEDAWVESESTKWPSLESLSNAKPPPPMLKSQPHKGSFKQRRPKNRGDRDSGDYRRSGNNGERGGDRRRMFNEASTDHGRRPCYGCGSTGHIIRDCPSQGSNDGRPKGGPRQQGRRV